MIDQALQKAIRRAWSARTAADDNLWAAENPAAGQCDVTFFLVREKGGGDLRMQVFRNGERSEHHFWNVLPDGSEMDLTLSQFDGSETFSEPILMDQSFFDAAGPMNAELVRRFELYRSALAASRVA